MHYSYQPLPSEVRKIAATFLLIFSSSNLWAFSVNGVQSGMTIDDALKVLKSRGDRVNPIGDQKGRMQSYIGISQGGLSESISVCDDKVVRYRYDIQGDFHAFARMVQKETEKSGASTSRINSDESPMGDVSTVEFHWAKGQETKEISYSLLATQSAQVSVSFALPTNCAKQSK